MMVEESYYHICRRGIFQCSIRITTSSVSNPGIYFRYSLVMMLETDICNISSAGANSKYVFLEVLVPNGDPAPGKVVPIGGICMSTYASPGRRCEPWPAGVYRRRAKTFAANPHGSWCHWRCSRISLAIG
jgi:hypothetical protein